MHQGQCIATILVLMTSCLAPLIEAELQRADAQSSNVEASLKRNSQQQQQQSQKRQQHNSLHPSSESENTARDLSTAQNAKVATRFLDDKFSEESASQTEQKRQDEVVPHGVLTDKHHLEKRKAPMFVGKRAYNYAARGAPYFVGKRFSIFGPPNSSSGTRSMPFMSAQEFKETFRRSDPYFVGKRMDGEDLELGEDFDDDSFLDKRGAPKFVGKRKAPMFIGKRFSQKAPMFVGKRLPTDYLDEDSLLEKRDAPKFVGKRKVPMFVGKRKAPMFVGKRSKAPMFVGKRYKAPMFVGKRFPQNAPMFVGKRYSQNAPMFVGKRFPQTAPMFVGKRFPQKAPMFVGKRDPSDLFEESDELDYYLKRGAPKFVGKREEDYLKRGAPKFVGKREDDYLKRGAPKFVGKRDNDDEEDDGEIDFGESRDVASFPALSDQDELERNEQDLEVMLKRLYDDQLTALQDSIELEDEVATR